MKFRILAFILIFTVSFTSCDVLKQMSQQNQNRQPGQNPGNQGTVTFEGQGTCSSAGRYVDPIFPDAQIKVFKDLVYATAKPSDQWNGGKNTASCFGQRPYKYASADGEDLRMDIYMPDPAIDNCTSKALLIYMHQGGFAPSNTPSKDMGSIAGKAKAMARLGYVVAVIDYRKGYDYTGMQHEAASLSRFLPKVTCTEGGTPDPNSITRALFRMIQDLRAAHRFLHANAGKLGTDNDKIFYMGMSTGSIGAAQAAYAADELQYWSALGMGSWADFGTHPELESAIKVAGVLAEQPAIHKIEWLEASDGVPIFMIQGSADRDVPFEKGHLAGLTAFNGKSSDIDPFVLYGSKSIYDRIRSFGGNGVVASLIAYDGVTHDTAPVSSGSCADLKGGQTGAWKMGYKFLKTIIDAKDSGTSPVIGNKYCLYKNPKLFNCQPVCD